MKNHRFYDFNRIRRCTRLSRMFDHGEDFDGNFPKRARPSSAEIRKALLIAHANRECIVYINKAHFLKGELQFSANLQVTAIRPDSLAIYLLLVGDQIVTFSGRLMNSVENLMKEMRKLDKAVQMAELTIIRQCNFQPSTRTRLLAALGLPKTMGLPAGYQYFAVTLRKIPGAHLGMKVQQCHGKVTVTEVTPNSIAFYNYMVGDSIIDINQCRINDITTFRELIKTSLKRYNVCTTLVERPDSQSTLYRSRVIVQALSRSREIDPTMAGDVVEIGAREACRYLASLTRSRSLQPALSTATPRPSTTSSAPRSQKSMPHRSGRRRREQGGAFRKMRRDNDERTESNDDVAVNRRRSTVTIRHTEDNIQTDAENPHFLQKVPKHKPPPSSLTFLTKIWKGS